jgi:hypothetical protein
LVVAPTCDAVCAAVAAIFGSSLAPAVAAVRFVDEADMLTLPAEAVPVVAAAVGKKLDTEEEIEEDIEFGAEMAGAVVGECVAISPGPEPRVLVSETVLSQRLETWLLDLKTSAAQPPAELLPLPPAELLPLPPREGADADFLASSLVSLSLKNSASSSSSSWKTPVGDEAALQLLAALVPRSRAAGKGWLADNPLPARGGGEGGEGTRAVRGSNSIPGSRRACTETEVHCALEGQPVHRIMFLYSTDNDAPV